MILKQHVLIYQMKQHVICAFGLCCCHKWYTDPNFNKFCDGCGRNRRGSFIGENSLTEFCDWLFQNDNNEIITKFIAHNSSRFDSMFILRYLHNQLIVPITIFKGYKLLMLTIKGSKWFSLIHYISYPWSWQIFQNA